MYNLYERAWSNHLFENVCKSTTKFKNSKIIDQREIRLHKITEIPLFGYWKINFFIISSPDKKHQKDSRLPFPFHFLYRKITCNKNSISLKGINTAPVFGWWEKLRNKSTTDRQWFILNPRINILSFFRFFSCIYTRKC